jgi:hypothetical protein
MATRVILGGRVAWASGRLSRPAPTLPRRKDGSVLEDERVDPSSPDSPYRAGVPAYDAADELEYRAVRQGALNPLEGWRTADFWLARWKTDWPTLRTFVQRGWLDAAVEEQSAVKRFRCRDENRVIAALAVDTKLTVRKGKRR